jgi:hypothetical protein
MKIQVRTLFDCSPTGVTGHFQSGKIPFEDRTGQTIQNEHDWHRSRNQQRNWETLAQIISLRAQPVAITPTQKIDHGWQFEFEVEAEGVYSTDEDPNNLDSLYIDCEGVPMMTQLDEASDVGSQLNPKKNIWFITVNNALE